MRAETRLALLVAVGLCVSLGAVVTLGAAHINHVAVDDQLSDDGTLHLEWEFLGVDGWVVVRADDGGEPGAAIGHRRTADTGFRTGTTVGIDEAAWEATTGTRDVWVVLHREERNDGFDLAVSPVDAEVAAEANETDTEEPVGAVALSAGVHRNVSVEVDESFASEHDGRQLLEAAVYRGENGFGDATTERLTAGEEPVGTTLGVEFLGASEATLSPTPAESAVVTTPPTETEASTPTPTPSGGDGDAAGAVAAVLALGAALGAARRQH